METWNNGLKNDQWSKNILTFDKLGILEICDPLGSFVIFKDKKLKNSSIGNYLVNYIEVIYREILNFA